MKQEIAKRVQAARNVTEARCILKEYRTELLSAIQTEIDEQAGNTLAIGDEKIDELLEVNAALRDFDTQEMYQTDGAA